MRALSPLLVTSVYAQPMPTDCEHEHETNSAHDQALSNASDLTVDRGLSNASHDQGLSNASHLTACQRRGREREESGERKEEGEGGRGEGEGGELPAEKGFGRVGLEHERPINSNQCKSRWM